MPKKSAQKKTTKKVTPIDPEEFRSKLKLKNLQTKLEFKEKFKKAHGALQSKGLDIGDLRKHSTKVVAAGAIAGSLALSPPDTIKALPPPPDLVSKNQELSSISQIPVELPGTTLRNAFDEYLPEKPRPLTEQEEKYLEKVIQQTTGVNAKASLEGEHLNTTYGKIGAEQHLRRYPGDKLSNHSPIEGEYGGENPDEILKEGIAPGLGAWGYFAQSADELTPDLIETEKWYAVVQTLYLPDWNTRQPYLKDWYKYRKVLIINTDNGKAVVASIADSGPAAFTGKQYGGSPEVMDYLGGPRYKKGPVLLFFVDDPNNEVPLGPVDYNKI